MLKEFVKSGLSLGPYLITYSSPLSKRTNLTPPVLFVDLTSIQEEAFNTIVDAYKEQVKRDDITDGQKIHSLSIKLLNVLLSAKAWTNPVEKLLHRLFIQLSQQKTGSNSLS